MQNRKNGINLTGLNHIKKIPPNLPLPKGGVPHFAGFPLLTKGDEGGLDRFSKPLKCYKKQNIFKMDKSAMSICFLCLSCQGKGRFLFSSFEVFGPTVFCKQWLFFWFTHTNQEEIPHIPDVSDRESRFKSKTEINYFLDFLKIFMSKCN